MFVLFPGRHHLLTTFQFNYLEKIIQSGLVYSVDIHNDHLNIQENIEVVIFAVTSANHHGTKRNPIPFYLRSMMLQNFSIDLPVDAYIYGVDDVGIIDDFASYTIKQIKHQSDGRFCLSPDNTVVMCSTPVLEMYQKNGFRILPAELEDPLNYTYHHPLPWSWVERIALNPQYENDPEIVDHVHPSSLKIWENYQLSQKVKRIMNDPIIGDDGDLTTSRDYNAYVRQMDEIAELKYKETSAFIESGNIGDIGCAVGSWIKLASEDPRFSESDFYGIEVARQLFNICIQRKENREFKNPYVFFSQKNAVTELVFERESMNTIHTSSLTHEIASYGSIQDLHHFIENRFIELKTGGIWINRDVIGPENGDLIIWLQLNENDGRNNDYEKEFDDHNKLKEYLDGLSTSSRFRRFALDFRKEENDQIEYSEVKINGQHLIELKYSDACEFLFTKDYTDNWVSEMHERFCFWSMKDWTNALKEVGFSILPGSEAYTNPWIFENRIKNKATIYQKVNGKLVPMPPPPTNALIVAKKII